MSEYVPTRNVVQIGLHNGASYIYLTRSGWVKECKALDKLNQLPEQFMDNPAPFRFYGVDCAPESIAYVASDHKGNERCRFLCAGVSDSFYCNWKLAQPLDWHKIEINSSIGYLMVPMKELPRLLDIQSIDVLAVDIDGYEYLIFNDIRTWNILPKFITIELHPFRVPEYRRSIDDISLPHLLSQLCDRMIDLGYKQHGYFEHNHESGVYEIQFLIGE